MEKKLINVCLDVSCGVLIAGQTASSIEDLIKEWWEVDQVLTIDEYCPAL